MTLYEQLRAELRRGPADGTGTVGGVAATRALAERFWPVSAERDVGHGPKAFVKRVLRKLMRWYVEPLAADQRVYNDSVLKLNTKIQSFPSNILARTFGFTARDYFEADDASRGPVSVQF